MVFENFHKLSLGGFAIPYYILIAVLISPICILYPECLADLFKTALVALPCSFLLLVFVWYVDCDNEYNGALKEQIEDACKISLDVSQKDFNKMLDGKYHEVRLADASHNDTQKQVFRGVIGDACGKFHRINREHNNYAYVQLYRKKIKKGKETLEVIEPESN